MSKCLKLGVAFTALWLFAGCAIIKESYVDNAPWESIPTLAPMDQLPLELSTPSKNGRIRSNHSVVIDYSDCAPFVLITKDTPWGTVVSIANVPLQSITTQQFNNVLLGTFHAPKSMERADIKIKVSSLRTIIKKIGNASVKCDIEFSVSVVANKNPNPLFSKNYHSKVEGTWNGVYVPLQVYQSVRHAAEEFYNDLASNYYIFDELTPSSVGGVSRPIPQEPAFLSFEMKQMSESGVYGGSCRIACNDWESSRAADWLSSELLIRARDQLGIPLERVRVIYEENVYDAKAKEWQVSFRAFARVAWFLDYNQFSRKGVCAVDLELAKLTAQQGAEKMKEYVMQEMNRRGIVVVEGKTVDGAGVRFDEFTTDTRYGIIRCTFKLIK